MTRTQRHHLIRRLVAAGGVTSQEALRRGLAAEGVSVTQATLSRDIKSLGLVKGPTGYVDPAAMNGSLGHDGVDALAEALAQQVVRAPQVAGTLVVLATRPGHANALGVEIDRAALNEVVGTIAGDDTIFIAARSDADARSLADRLARFARGDERAA